MRVLLDTNVVSDFWTDVELPPGAYAVSTVTLAEMHYGVVVAGDEGTRGRRMRLLARVMQNFEPLPVDDAVAASHALVADAVRQSGRRPQARAFDLLIAATAHAHDAELFTRNVAAYEQLGHLIAVRSA